MSAKKADTASTWVDPDDAPELTEEFFEKAIPMIGDRVVSKEEFQAAARVALKPGRVLGSGTKSATTIRLDTGILSAFKATGKGWQTRINNALLDWLKEHNPA